MGYVKKSNRKDDISKEHIVAKFMLDVYRDNGFVSVKAKKELDIKGIDVILYKNNKQYLVDEKAAITALCGKLNTFCFELCKHGYNDSIGWFLDKTKLTTHYNVIYITSRANDVSKPDKIESFLLDSAKLRSYIIPMLQKHNIHYDTLASFMYSMPVFHGKHYCYLDDGVKLCYSEYIHPEQPINVIVPKTILRNMADCVLYKEFTRR